MWATIGGVKTYAFLYGLGIVVHLAVVLFYCRRMRIPVKVGFALGCCYLFGMVIGAKILYDLLHSRFHLGNYLDFQYYFIDGMWGGPLAYLALAVGGVVLLARDRRKHLDLVALSLPVPMILAKLTCFCNGCCYGAASDAAWAVTFPEAAEAPSGIARHPTQLYEILVLLLILAVFHLLDRRRWKGTLLMWFVMFYGIGRPLTELFRAAQERVPFLGPFTSSQAVCLAAALVSAVTLLVIQRRGSADSALVIPRIRG